MALIGLGTLSRVPAASRPLTLPGAASTGIVHVGIGAFHRAHQAVYTEEAVAAAGGDWGIAAVAPHSADVVTALRAQDRLFSVTSLGRSTRVIGAFSEVLHAAADADVVISKIADPRVRVVTLCMTEKGYFTDPATGKLLPGASAGIPGLLLRGLDARRRADAGPLAVVSCDNLPSNGRRTRSLFQQLCPSGPLADWIAAGVTFPGTMVDRIVPAGTAATLAAAAAALGVEDRAAVAAEPFKQWVIEDDFPGGRPAWEAAGAVLTGDAGPWERLKLRTLNGVHSGIAYLGALAGRRTVLSALELPGMREVMGRFIADDVAGSLTPPPGVTVVGYGDSVLERFADPAIEHRTVQIAKDGSQKLPQRVLHTIADRRAAGASPRWAALVVAAWMRYVQGVADDGSALPLDDPLGPAIRAALAGASTPAEVRDALFGLSAVFPPELAGDAVVRELCGEWLEALTRHGAAAVLAGVR
ncbi:mannitol dehydrogenase family protein [Actinoplanes sp. NPDC089786]|uniref:mannitol dehydrogenase family protein n=1 Tax=Actinoplanes sp. NPDC089786 TaxID=3155185 RepID=UPI00343D02B7